MLAVKHINVPPFARPAVDRLEKAYEAGRAEGVVSITRHLASVTTIKESGGRYGWLSEWSAKMDRAIDGPKHRNEVTIPARQVENLERIPLEAIVSGEIKEYERALFTAGRSAKEWTDQLLAGVLAENPDGFDGVPLFSSKHPDLATESAATWSNDLEARSWEAMRGPFADESGAVALAGTDLPDDITRVLADRTTVVFSPHLAGKPYWYAVASPAQGFPLIFQVRSEVELMMHQQSWEFFIGPAGRAVYGGGLPRNIVRCRYR